MGRMCRFMYLLPVQECIFPRAIIVSMLSISWGKSVMALPEKRYYSVEEYTKLLLESDTKLEYVNGEIYAMAGASQAHVDIEDNVFGLLYTALRGKGCRPSSSDMCLEVEATGSRYFPDISVTCGERRLHPDESIAVLLNPTILIEVLSPSTELKDRKQKFYEYIQIPSLQDYLLIAQDEPRIERFSRGEGELWTVLKVEGLNSSIEIPSLSLTLKLADVYERVEFPSENPTPQTDAQE